MIKVGVIGCGYWGPNLIRNFMESGISKVVMVCDLDQARLARISSRYPTILTTKSADELIRNKDIDAVVVATPVSTHFELAMQSLQAGKQVLVEKPMTTTFEESARLIDEAAKRGCILMVDHTFVYTGAVNKLRELVTSGELGEVLYYDSTRINLGLFQHDINVIWDLAVHDLSIMDFVIPSVPVAVSATGLSHVKGQPENVAYLTLFFEQNIIGHVHVNWLAPVKLRRTLIGGSQKMAVYDDLDPSEKLKIYDKGITVNRGPEGIYQMLISYRTGDMWSPQIDGTEALQTVSRHFVSCIEHAQVPLTDGEAGLRIVRMLESAVLSMSKRGEAVELNLNKK